MPEKRMMSMKIPHIYDDYGSVLGGISTNSSDKHIKTDGGKGT